MGKLYISFLKNHVSYRTFSYILMEPSRPWENVGMVVGEGNCIFTRICFSGLTNFAAQDRFELKSIHFKNLNSKFVGFTVLS